MQKCVLSVNLRMLEYLLACLYVVSNCFLMTFIASYAVLDGNTCLCTSTLNEKEVELDECNRPCTEDASEFCGGGYVQSVYDTEIRVPGPPQNANIINHKDTSILIEWSAPEQKATLTRYVIRAKVVKNYGTMLQAAPPEWTVETTDHTVQYELLNLHPGN